MRLGALGVGRVRMLRAVKGSLGTPSKRGIRNSVDPRMKDYHINIFYSDADKGYIADIPDLDACSAFGKTPTDALK